MKILIRVVWVHLILALTPLAAQAAIGVNSDTYSIPADGILLVEPDGVIANDTMNDVDNSPQFVLDIAINHTLSVISLPSEGTLKCGNTVNTICADGSFQFTVSPTTFSGVDSFTYRLEVDKGLPGYEFADTTVNLSACSTTGTETICWTEGSFFAALAATEDTFNPYYVKHEGFEGAAWTPYRSYQNPPPDSTWVYNGATTITSKGIAWSTNHSATNRLSTSTGGTYSGTYGVFDPDHGHATNTSTGSCQALETANNGVVPPECLPYDGFSGSSATTLYAVGGYIKGSNAAANIEIITDGGLPNNIGKLVTPAHQFYGVIDTAGFTSFQFRDIDGKTGQPLFIFGDDFYLVSRDAADANQAPVIGAIADQTVAAGSLFQIDIPVSDPDGDAVDAVLSGLPTGASLLENTLGSIRIRWITPSTAAGIYPVSVTFTDNGYPRISQVLNFTLTVTDPPPTLNLPANITAEATASTGATVNFLVTASDATGASLSASCNPASGTTFTIATTTVNCSVTDGNSLTTTGSFTVKVQDSTAPTVTAPPNIIREASAATTAVSLGSGSATDAVDGNLIPTPNNNGPFTVGIHSITWSATDSASNTGTATQTVTITDSVAPVLTLPDNISTQATGPTGAVVNYSATAIDAISGNLSVNCSKASGSSFALGTTTVTCTSAADGANNTTSGSFSVTVVDTINPVVTAPPSITMEATGPTTAVNLGSASASDAVSVSLVPTASNSGPFGVGIHSIIWSATDSSNNTGTATQTVTITDTTAPDLSLPVSFSAEATSASGAAVSYTSSANDLVDGSIVPTCTPISGSTFAPGTTAVSCSVTDSANLTASGSFNITVVDTTPPAVTAPLDITVEATGATTPVSLGTATATDLVDGSLIPSANNSGPFTVGVHSITWSATDTASNTGTATQTVTITDTIAPNLNLPANISQGATSANGAVVNYTVTANDIADGTIVASCSPLSGSNFALGTTAVNCSASDNSNNSVSGSFNVTITDTGAPTLSLSANISRQATAATGATVTYSATASDAIDGPIPANCSPASGSTFALGDHVVNCSAQDLEGNISNGSFIVSIIDTTPPIVTAPLDVSVEATAAVTAVTLGNASAIDLVSGTLTAVASNSGPFAVGVHTISWSATDAANNTGTATQIVTVTDTLAPILSLPVNISHEATSAAGAVVNYTATANDIVDGALPSGCLPASGSTFALGTTTVSCSVTDSASQTTSGSFSVTVQDTTGPALTIPADISINTTSSTGAIVSYSVTATDAVDGPIVPNCLPASGSNFALGSTAVSCNASDNLNNTSTGSFKVTVINTAVNGQPVADAGSPQTVSFGSSVTLNGSASSDPDGDALQYQWTLVSKPQGSLAEIVNATLVSASFDPDQPGDYQAQLIVTDINNSRSLASRVIITVVNNAPVAHAGTDQTVFVGDLVTLNGILSSDTNADTLTYQWTLSVPAGSFAVLTRATSVNPEFTVDVAGIYTVQLTVNDGRVDSILADTVVITAQMPVDVAPTISAPADIRVPSTGYLTPIAPGVATATDPEDGVLQPVADNTGPFKTGRHVITWSVTDSGNNTVTAIQIVEVLPMVNFQLDQQAEAGALIEVNLNMNGLAPQYPVDVNYDLTVNGSTISKTLSIASGKSAVINYQVPATANAGDRITFSLKTAINAEVGANSIHHVTLINTNVAPIVDFEVTQNGVSTKNLHSNGGLVTVTAIVHDDNQSDTHSLDWSTTDNNLTPPGSVKTFSFDPANLLEGNYKIGVKVVDSGALEAENEIYVHISAQDFTPVPGADSDKDGIEDALEGDHDDDNDGVPNYLDAIDEQPEMLQMQAAESNRWIISTQSGLSLRLGKTAQLNGRYGANITPAELAQFAGLGRVTAQADTNDSDYTTTDGYLDFTINGLTKPGQSVKMVIPLLSPVPDLAVYRKYSADTGWSNFVIDAANELYSAPGADGVCPAPGSIDYLPGLEPGDYCVQMLIQDGGPNDNDLLRNAVITDPGGLAVAVTATTTPPITVPTTTAATSGSSGGGGGAIDIQSLLSMMMLLTVLSGYRVVLIRRKFGGVE